MDDYSDVDFNFKDADELPTHACGVTRKYEVQSTKYGLKTGARVTSSSRPLPFLDRQVRDAGRASLAQLVT
jgi:hypothetical protein